MRLVHVGNFYSAHRPFADLFTEVVDCYRGANEFKFTKDDVVLFGGGGDIWAGFYGQKPNRYNHTQRKDTRDAVEEIVFSRAAAAGAKMLGICRGAQLLCAMAGGTVIQHVTHHSGSDHSIVTDTGDKLHVCSVHHQMMNPENSEHKLIAWTDVSRSTCYLGEKDTEVKMEVEPEIVFFPKIQALGIQYHPEFMSMEDEAVEYARSLVKEYLLQGEKDAV